MMKVGAILDKTEDVKHLGRNWKSQEKPFTRNGIIQRIVRMPMENSPT
jgi:hypothetical protein